MSTQLDLRDCPEDDRATTLFDALSDADPGETVDVVADSDVDPELVRYQLDRERALDWEYADPDAEPRELAVTVGDVLDGELATIDVRDLKPQRRHEALLDIFDDLDADEGVLLVNDHDPKPLYHELRSMHGDVVEWSYASRGADGWRVEVTKTGASESADDDDVVTRYDVREIPKAERHPTIHHRYGMLPDGGTMELVAPHEPRPLHREFRQRYGDDFEWSVVETEPGRCRVHVTKAPAGDGTPEDGESTGDAESDAEASSQSSADEVAVVEELDVRDRPPAERHERIFDAYDELATGEGFVLVNDHDPKPLYHQFEAEAGPEFRWTYRQRDPGEFRVLVGKADVAGSDGEREEPEPPF